MAMHDNGAMFDQPVGKTNLFSTDVVAPVSTPMDRRHKHIALALEPVHLVGDAARGSLRNILEKVDARAASGRGPFPRNAARRRAKREDEHAALSWHVEHCRSSSRRGVAT